MCSPGPSHLIKINRTGKGGWLKEERVEWMGMREPACPARRRGFVLGQPLNYLLKA